MPSLRLDYCGYAAAKFAVLRWHYSRSMPASKTVKIGIWEDDHFIGAVIFAWGSNAQARPPVRLSDAPVL